MCTCILGYRTHKGLICTFLNFGRSGVNVELLNGKQAICLLSRLPLACVAGGIV